MKTIKQFFFILLFCLLLVNISSGQDNLQNIYQPVFNNPAYNSFNDCYSANMIVRNQWGGKVTGSPEVYGVNLFVPTARRLGFSLQAVDEEQGLSSRFTMLGIMSHHIKLTEKSDLGFGYGVGFDYNSYDINKIYEYNPDIILSDNDLENELNAKISVGLFYRMPFFYSGFSFNTTLNSEYSSYKVVRGFDWIAGSVVSLNDYLALKPELAVKYYRIKESIYTSSNSTDEWIDPIFNLGINALLKNRVWLGVNRRFEYAQTYSVAFYINSSLKLGYTFEKGIGNGINQFDSHVFRLSWNLEKKQGKKASSDNDENVDEAPAYFTHEAKNSMYW